MIIFIKTTSLSDFIFIGKVINWALWPYFIGNVNQTRSRVDSDKPESYGVGGGSGCGSGGGGGGGSGGGCGGGGSGGGP